MSSVRITVIERAARAMADDWNPDRDPILTAMFRDYANTLAAAGLLAPSDTFASTKPSDAEHLLSVVETIKETGGSVQIRGVLITPCDTYGQPLSARPDADVAERIAQALEEAAEKHPNPIVRLNLSDAADIARSHATLPVAVEVEWEWHLRDESGDLWTGPFASEEQAQAARRESRPHWIVVRRRRAGPWIEVPPVAATGEGDDRG